MVPFYVGKYMYMYMYRIPSIHLYMYMYMYAVRMNATNRPYFTGREIYANFVHCHALESTSSLKMTHTVD